jgi:biopolymer transport protein ExbD
VSSTKNAEKSLTQLFVYTRDLNKEAEMRLALRILLILTLSATVGFWGWNRLSRRSTGIYVGLPAHTSDPECAFSSIVLNISKPHSVKLNYDSVRFESLPATLKHVYGERYDQILFVRADSDVTFQDVMEIIDSARRAVPDVHLILLTPGLERIQPCLVGHLPEKMSMNIDELISTPS